MKFKVLVLVLIAVVSVEGPVWGNHEEGASAKNCKKHLVNDLRDNAGEVYLRVHARAKAAFAAGNAEFEYTEMKPAFEAIKVDAERRLRNAEHYSAVERKGFAEALPVINKILERNIPYFESIRFYFKYLDLVDAIFRRLNPNMVSHYNRHLAEPLVEKALNRAPDLFVYVTFDEVDKRFFLRSAKAGMFLYGADFRGSYPEEYVSSKFAQPKPQMPFADGYDLPNDEFTYHDVGHGDYNAVRMLEFFATDPRSREEIIRDWDRNEEEIYAFLESLQIDDQDLHDAAEELLFELMHERGFLYDARMLQAQLATPKWTDVILRKLERNYYARIPVNKRLFSRLEDARRVLLGLINQMVIRQARQRVEVQVAEARAKGRSFIWAEVRHLPEYRHGIVKEIRINGQRQDVVKFEDELGRAYEISMFYLPLAQIDAVKPSPFTPGLLRRIEACLHATGRQGGQLMLNNQGEFVVYGWNGNPNAQNLEEIEFSNAPEGQRNLDTLEIFKFEQLINMMKNGLRVPGDTTLPPQRILISVQFPGFESLPLSRM